MSSLLEFRDVELGYRDPHGGTFRAGPMNFTLCEGETLGLLGESGAGKSTVGFEILGLLGFKGGTRLRGEVFRNCPLSEIAYVPQDPFAALDPFFSVGSQLREI